MLVTGGAGLHRLEPRRPVARRRVRRRRHRRPLDRIARQPRPGARRSAAGSSRSTASTCGRPTSSSCSPAVDPRSCSTSPPSRTCGRPVERPMFDAEVNILGSLNVLRGRAGGRGAEGGLRRVGGHVVRRTRTTSRSGSRTRSDPLSPYGVSKKAVVDYLHYYREIQGLEHTVLALANVYGPRQDPHGEAGVVVDLRRHAARRAVAHDLRRRQADPRLRVRRRRRRRVRPRRRTWWWSAHEHRHRRRDEHPGALHGDGPIGGRRPDEPRYARRGRASRPDRRSIRGGPRSTSGGSRGRPLEEGLEHTLGWFQRHAVPDYTVQAELVERDGGGAVPM